MGREEILVDTYIQGSLKVTNIPNSPGSIITYNPLTNQLSTRTNAQIIQDLDLPTFLDLSMYITRDSENSVVNDEWRIASASGEGYITFTGQNYFRIGWGASAATFTDEGMIDLFQYGIRQEGSDGANFLFADTYLKNVFFENPQGTTPFNVQSNTLIPNLNADFLDGFHASSFAKGTDLGNYYLKTGGVLSGRMDIISDNGVGSFKSSSAGSNYLTWNRHDNTGALAYIGADSGVIGGGVGYNFVIRAANGGNLQLVSDTSNILANGEIVATRPWVTDNFVPKTRSLTINGVTQDLSVNRTWNLTGNYISRDILSGRSLADANTPAVATDFYYLNGANRPQDAQDGVLQTFSFDNNLWYTQIFSDWRTNEWYVRNKNNGAWMPWRKLLHTGNFSTDGFIKVDTNAGLNNVSDAHSNQTWFDYNWANTGKAGSVLNFSGLGNGGRYNVELFGEYQDGNAFWLRNKNGDTGDWHDPVKILHTGNFNPQGYVLKSGDTLTGGGKIAANGNITLQQSSTGGNATGLFWETTDDSAIMAGTGAMTGDGLYEYSYMGWGINPWDRINNFAVSPDRISYKDYNVFHAGASIDYDHAVEDVIKVGYLHWAQRKVLSTFWDGNYGDHVILRPPGLSPNTTTLKLAQNGNGYINDKKILTELDSNGFVKIGGTGTFNNPILLGWDNNNLRITVDNSYIGYIWHSNNLDPVTRNTYQNISARKEFSGATGNTYDTGAIMINGNGSNLFPTIGFHQSGIVGATISVRNDSNLYYNDNIILHEGNINNYGFVTLAGSPQTITSQKTFNANVGINGAPGGNPLKVHGAIDANGIVSNSNQSFDEIFTTDGSQRNVAELGKRTIQFNFDVDGLQHLLSLQPVHSLAVVPVGGSGIEDTMIILPKEARLGQEVEIINHSDVIIYIAGQGNTSNPTPLSQGNAMRAVFEIDANAGDINEDKFKGGRWINARIYNFNIL